MTILCVSLFPKSLLWINTRTTACSHRQHLEETLYLDGVHISFFSLIVRSLSFAYLSIVSPQLHLES